MLRVLVDADACPVKDEIYRVALRYGCPVTLVANQWMRTPHEGEVELEVVKGDFDAADDRIVELVEPDDVVITADIPLASRCLEKGAQVIGPKGKPFTEDNIGDALASRELLADLRATGEVSGGPPPMQKKDRSLFLQKLDQVIQGIRRKHDVS